MKSIARQSWKVLGLAAAAAAHGQAHDMNAARSDEECTSIEPSIARVTGLGNQSLDFFISAAGDVAYYIGGGNHAIRLGTDRAISVPGYVDPVPTPDGRFLTTPGMAFYSGTEIQNRLTRGEDANNVTSLHRDDTLRGVYQSIGITQRSGNRATYRVITDASGASFRDYASTGNDNVTPVGETHVLCESLQSSQRQLPMISKDGRYLSAYDSNSATTKIYDIGADGRGCSMVADLGFPTGKVDFDFTNDRITFHLDFFNFQSGYFSGVDNYMTKDVFVAKLSKDGSGRVNGVKSIARLSSSPKLGSGTYYPRWTGNGQIVASRDVDDSYSLAEFDPNRADYAPFWSPTQTNPATKADHARHALGRLWAKVCGEHSPESNFKVKPEESGWFALSLSRTACQRLIRQYWAEKKADIRTELGQVRGLVTSVLGEVDEADLMGVCPTSDSPGNPVIVGSDGQHQATPETLFQSKCQECHHGGYVDPQSGRQAPAIAFPRIPLDQLRASRRMINSRSGRTRMPPSYAGQLSDEEKQMLTEYLNNLEQELLQ